MRIALRLMLIVFVLSLLAPSTAVPQEAEAQSVWKWSFDQIREQVNKARAGRSLKPASWPNGARVAVLFSFDADNETENMIMGDMSIFGMTSHEYGARRGLARIVSFLDRHELPASFFIPTVSNMLAPEMIPLIQRSGRHEIGVHGWIHEYNSKLSKEEQRELTARAIDYLQKQTGRRPLGYRAPWGDVSKDTLEIVRQFGFLYDSSMLSDDTPYEILHNGESTGMVELPVNLILEDSVLNVANTFSAGIMTPRDVLQVWIDEFDRAYEEGTMFLLVAHPHVIGQRSRILVLEKLVEHMKARGNVWFATHRQAAEWVKQHGAVQ